MKVNPIGLKKVIQKSSFNYRLEGSSILFETDTITSRMISPDNTYAVILNCPNDVITAIESKKGVELNFDVKNKPFAKGVFHQFNTDMCSAKLEGDEFIIADDADMTATFAMTNLDHILIKDALTEFTSNIETSISLDKEFIHHALGLCRSATKAKVSEIQFIVEKDKPSLKFKNEENSEAGLQLSGSITGKIDHDVSMSFRRKDLNEVLKLVKSERQKEYQIKFIYDDSQKSGFANVESNDGTEQYVLYSKREKTDSELISFEQRYDITPEVPMEWSFTASVEKVKANVYKWKNLGKEILNELWIAREILSKSKSEAAKILHGTIVPHTSWTQYCEDIGSSRQVVNRWLQRAFGNLEDPDAELKLIEDAGDGSGNTVQSDPKTGFSNAYMKSIQKVVGKGKDKIVDAYNGRNAPEKIQKLMNDLESGSANEAIVHVNSHYTYREWFKPLFDGLMCFTNDNQESNCFVYIGDKREKFISEFKKHGVVMQKVE